MDSPTEPKGNLMKRIAIIGSGISGMSAAYMLSQQHHVTLFEASELIGGHTATKRVSVASGDYDVDTGFIVFNDRTYPNFLKLLDRIGLLKQPTEMSFSVCHSPSGLEYNGNNLLSLFAQRRNWINPRFYHFLYSIVRFNKLAKSAHASGDDLADLTLGDFLQQHGFGDYFCLHYILPMVAAIWSSSVNDARVMPLKFFLKFFINHGLLEIEDRPQWYVIPGGSHSYIPFLLAPVQDVRSNTPVIGVRRGDEGVDITTHSGTERFDEVVIACHSDQALALLSDASKKEQAILGRMKYRNNDVVLHTDIAMLPKRRAAWASWNYSLAGGADAPPSVTYDMNILQGIDAPETFCVTLNKTEAIDPNKILGRYEYAHPVMDEDMINAQSERDKICGVNRTHFCGAYWYNGFHEDGLRSALDVCARFNITL
jgi:predicted NAD/FAD-binding protein